MCSKADGNQLCLTRDSKTKSYMGKKNKKQQFSKIKPLNSPRMRGISPVGREGKVYDVKCEGFVKQVIQSVDKLPKFKALPAMSQN